MDEQGDSEVFTEEELKLPPCKYEYLDHTADVQLHAWGDSLQEAFEQCGLAMYGYMTELPTVEIKQSAEIEAEGHDLESLLYKFLDELLFLFSCEPYLICSKVKITEFKTEGEALRIKCKCYGEEFTLGKHPQGTEVKAITYSAMQIVNEPAQNRKCCNDCNRIVQCFFKHHKRYCISISQQTELSYNVTRHLADLLN